MKYLDEYRDKDLARALADKIRATSVKPISIMEICGTHTVAIFRHGIRHALPENITLVSGPGCPVCVTDTREIDQAIKLAQQKDTIVTTFGDLMRVPGSASSLSAEKANGADVRMVYSTFDALQIARDNPSQTVAFLGVGFETTAPTVAAALQIAKLEGIENFCVFSAHKLLPPAMDALLSSGELQIGAFLCPGHVSVIIGTSSYEKVARAYGTPCVVTGFEPVDILEGIWKITRQIEQGEAKVEIQYSRVVNPQGNPKALELLDTVFEPVDAAWRGMGVIPRSGLGLNDEYRDFDASRRFDLTVPEPREPKGCACGDVIRGVTTPAQCALFRTRCTPRSPIGPCMVSSEGTCAAYYKYFVE